MQINYNCAYSVATLTTERLPHACFALERRSQTRHDRVLDKRTKLPMVIEKRRQRPIFLLGSNAYKNAKNAGCKMDALVMAGEEKARAREVLMARYNIESEFVRVETLSRVMGMSAAMIYAHIRKGTFCMRFRRVGAAPLVKLDDLIDWYCLSPSMTATTQVNCNAASEVLDAIPADAEELAKAKRSEALMAAAMKSLGRQSQRPVC